jgi:alpha-L-rhamnosidase
LNFVPPVSRVPMASFSLGSLCCEYLVDPLGLDDTQPRLSWALEGDRRGLRQTAYRIQVATTPERLLADSADLWDSGRVESDRTTQVGYRGETLRSRQHCWWQVEAWDEAGEPVRSAPARWSMGLLEAADWKASWIAADPAILAEDPEAFHPSLTEPGTPACFRRSFRLEHPVRRATLYASARGLFEPRLNGQRIGEDLFAPEWTDYERRIHYRTYDLTTALQKGSNVLGAILGDGWWSGFVGWQEQRGRYGSLENSLLLQLEVELENGETVLIASDDRWICGTGAIRQSDFMMGEFYDGRRENIGWDFGDFEDGRWRPARVVTAPSADLVAQRSEPVRITERLHPVSCRESRPGVFIYDLGQNIAGWVHLQLLAPPGTRLVLRHAERLTPEGELYTANLRRAKATDTIIVGPSGKLDWQPRFTFHGFQYFELSGLKEPPPEGAVTGCLVQSATPPAGHFECSHPGVNRLWQNGVWSQRDNFLSVPTDCPQRDERLGWMGDAQVFLRTASYNANVAAFFTKWMVDVEDAQTPEGIFPDVAPRVREDLNFVGLDDLCGGPGWADAGIIIPFTLWQVYGDFRLIERHWKAMTAWLDYLERTNPDHLRVNELRNNYGDWLCIPSDREFRTHSPMKDLLATAYWADGAAKMARMARALGRDEEARRFETMFDRVRAAFKRAYVLPDGRLRVETQTAYLLALAFKIFPMAMREAATRHLVELIEAAGDHLLTGFIGIRHLNPTLTLNGRNDVAYRLLLQDTYPSWLYPVNHGATTIWERWNGWTEADGFFDPLMNSFNHYSLGSVGEWLFRHVAGIELDEAHPGFQRFVLRPYPGSGLAHARATYRTLHGEISSAWRWSEGCLEWTFTIPPNCSATVFAPCDEGTEATLDGAPLEGSHEGARLRVTRPAGTYALRSRYSA